MVRDYGRGIPLGKVKEVASDINTGGKFDDKNFKKSVGLNGVGLKAVNALSTYCHVASVRDGKRWKSNSNAEISSASPSQSPQTNPTAPRSDSLLTRRFPELQVQSGIRRDNGQQLHLSQRGLQLFYNGRKYYSRHGLLDLLRENMTNDPLYPIIHLSGEDIEVVLTHTDQYGEEYYSFVNGQHTTRGNPPHRFP